MASIREYLKQYRDREGTEDLADIVGDILKLFQKEIVEKVEGLSEEAMPDDLKRVVEETEKRWRRFAKATNVINLDLFRIFIMNASPDTFTLLWTMDDIEFMGFYTKEVTKAMLQEAQRAQETGPN